MGAVTGRTHSPSCEFNQQVKSANEDPCEVGRVSNTQRKIDSTRMESAPCSVISRLCLLNVGEYTCWRMIADRQRET
jgi:hypothetical protein